MEEPKEKREVRTLRKKVQNISVLNMFTMTVLIIGSTSWGDTRWWIFLACGITILSFTNLFRVFQMQKRVQELLGTCDEMTGIRKVALIFLAVLFLCLLLVIIWVLFFK